jgi:hypothetical protein
VGLLAEEVDPRLRLHRRELGIDLQQGGGLHAPDLVAEARPGERWPVDLQEIRQRLQYSP